MTYGLLTSGAATVLVGDGNWMGGYEVDGLSCGRVIQGTDICTPIDIPEPDESGTGFRVEPFGVEGHQKFSVMCSPDENLEAMDESMATASEYVVAKQFWDGAIEGWKGVDKGLFLEDADIVTVGAAANTGRSIALAIKTAYDNHPEILPVVHLGLGAAADYASDFFVAEKSGIKFIVSPGYPIDGIAVTGPIVVRLSSIQTLKSYDETINREYVQGTRIAAVEFDPCLAVRVV